MPKVTKQLKLQVQAGKATPTGKVGPALGQAGVNIGDFVNKFNEATKNLGNDVLPVVVSVYEDRSFDFVVKTPPASDLLKKAAGIQKGSGKNKQSKAGKISKDQIREIAERKLPDLSAHDVEGAMRIIEGSARSIGIEVQWDKESRWKRNDYIELIPPSAGYKDVVALVRNRS